MRLLSLLLLLAAVPLSADDHRDVRKFRFAQRELAILAQRTNINVPRLVAPGRDRADRVSAWVEEDPENAGRFVVYLPPVGYAQADRWTQFDMAHETCHVLRDGSQGLLKRGLKFSADWLKANELETDDCAMSLLRTYRGWTWHDAPKQRSRAGKWAGLLALIL